MKEGQKHKIGMVAIVLLVVFAIVCDLIGLIPIAKDFTATIFWGIASFFFWTRGMGLFNGRKLATMAISWVSGMIPLVQEIPVELLAGIIAIIIITRVEEKTGVSLIDPMKKGVMPAPMYKDGKRLPWDAAKPFNEGGIRNSGATVNVTTQRDDLIDKENRKYTAMPTTNNISTSSYTFGNGGAGNVSQTSNRTPAVDGMRTKTIFEQRIDREGEAFKKLVKRQEEGAASERNSPTDIKGGIERREAYNKAAEEYQKAGTELIN